MKREQVLEKAKKCVCGDRDEDYGKPGNNFGMIAKLWSVYLSTDITSEDVANMMALLKIARIATGRYKADNYVDLAGYAACAAEVAEYDYI